jgi:hypothetical protein
MRNIVLCVAAAALLAAGAVAQENAGSGSYGHAKERKAENSATAKVGGPAPPDAAQGTSEEGRPRAGIEYGTASATQGGRTDTGAPVERSPVQRGRAGEGRDNSDLKNPASRAKRQGETEDRELNRIPEQGATMMTPKEQKKQRAAARRRSKQRDNSIQPRSTEQKSPDPDAATVPRKSERQQ